MLLSEQLQEARLAEVTYKIRTVRTRKDGKYMKISARKWVRMPEKRRHPVPKGRPWREPGAGSDPAYAGDEMARLKETVRKLDRVVRQGKTITVEKKDGTKTTKRYRLQKGMSLKDHYKEAEGLIKVHKRGYTKFLDKLDTIAPHASTIRGRTKTLESSLGKLERQPHNYSRAKELRDLTGAQVVLANDKEVKEAVARIEKEYRVLVPTKFMKGQRGYRSHHIIVEMDGQPKEIQVRTKNQDAVANWSHNAFKPLSRRQKGMVKKYRKQIIDYAVATAEYFDKIDAGSQADLKRPECPPEVDATLGCID